METEPLKKFATWARRELITQVSARLTAVLAPGSIERVENRPAVGALERDIAAAGGGTKGKDTIAHKVAYTWFNRIIALRFMDANGFTGIGVVSPAHGQQAGQPEILADAKRGSINPNVVTKRRLGTITGLLDGTRPSSDAQGEAYALLLTEYCRYWNRSMPFMFEREGDYTELLIPANLLAADSFLGRTLTALSEEVCRDVEVIGWLYQFYVSERKDEVFAGFKRGKKAGADEIPAATQLFTPHWIVRYLVENSVGRLWMLNHPESRLIDQMDYYIAPVDEETDFLKISSPEELTVIDPACGSGHMLTYAFDLLYAIYEEEGYAPSEIPGLILTHNLFGTEIDPRAGALAAFALTMKARTKQRTFFNKSAQPNIRTILPITFSSHELEPLTAKTGEKVVEQQFWTQFAEADIFGALLQPTAAPNGRLTQSSKELNTDGSLFEADIIRRAGIVLEQAKYLTTRYSVVVTNPPYMGTRNMHQALRQFAENNYPNYSGDLCTMFIDRSLDLTAPKGLAALVVSESWLVNTTYKEMRQDLTQRARPIITACIDKIAFGVRLNTAASIFERETKRRILSFFRITQKDLTNGPPATIPPANTTLHKIDFHHFEKVPSGAFLFDMPHSLLSLYKGASVLGDTFEAKQGLATADNNQFVRLWWEVSQDRLATGCANWREASQTGRRWFPYNKGGTPIPWWGNQDHVINWENDGQAIRAFGTENGGRPRSAVRNPEFYFRPSVTWSNIGSNGARFRLIPQGFIFDVAGMSVFTTSPEKQSSLLGYLNSTVVRAGLDILAPTLNYQVGDVARLPLVNDEGDNVRVERLVALSHSLWMESETAHEFAVDSLVSQNHRSLQSARASLQAERKRRTNEIQELERQSDEYWMSRIENVSGKPVSTHFPHAPRTFKESTAHEDVQALVSYAIGCMLGRYSLDKPGLIFADQGAAIQSLLPKVRLPAFLPDTDNVLPIVDGDWFEDDIVVRFRQFLRAAFGEEHFEENLRFVEESLGVRSLREYFITRTGRSSFYDDHVTRYKRRPIYWMFSSSKGSFNALIYMHRYTPSTVSTVLNEYLREYIAKLKASLQHQERLAIGEGTSRQKAAALKEAERLRNVLLELHEYEHDVLYPLASQQITIDLDDGVLVNYLRFGKALARIPEIEKKRAEVETWTWPIHPLKPEDARR